MTDITNRWKLGLFVVAALAAFITGMTWIAFARLQKRTIEVVAYFDEAVTGLDAGAPVRFRGVPIGAVHDIRVAPDKKHIAVIANLYYTDMESLGLDPTRVELGEPLPPGLRAQIVQSALTGTAYVQVDYFIEDAEGPPPYPFEVPVNTIKTVPSTFKSLEEGARDLVRNLPILVQEAHDLLLQVREDLAQTDVPGLTRALRETVNEARRFIERVDASGVLGESRDAMAEIRLLAHSLRDEGGAAQTLLADLGVLARDTNKLLADARLPEAALDVRRSATGMAAEVSALGADLRLELQTLRRALLAIERLADTLERDPAAILRGRGAGTSPLQGRKE